MEKQERRIGDGAGSSTWPVMDSHNSEEHWSASVRVDVLDGSTREAIAHGIAPEQAAVPCDAPTVAVAVAHECIQALELSQAVHTGRVLLLEPHAEAVGRTLRTEGFQGECVVLQLPGAGAGTLGGWPEQTGAHEVTTLAEMATQDYPPLPMADLGRQAIAPVFDRVIVTDWLAAARERQAQKTPPEERFQAVVALGLSYVLSPEEWKAALGWLKGWIAPEGFLITGEPDGWVRQGELEVDLLPEGFLLAADARRVETEPAWRVLRWQHRPNDVSRLPTPLVRVRRADLEASAALRAAMTAAYREVFCGDEWGEWMWCTACGRIYSRGEYEGLNPADQCLCGAAHSLEAFHTLESVLAELRRDLADDENSRLYVSLGEAREVEAFIWGYITTAHKIAEILLPRQGEAERERLTTSLLDCLRARGVAEPETVPIYHQAYIGSVKQARSFSLPRVLFARMCQFAADRGVQLAVTATIPSVNAYALLRGIEMDVVYSFPPLPTEARQPMQYDGREIPYSRLDDSGVVLSGSVDTVLSILTSKSDRALVKAVGTFLRQQRGRERGADGPLET